MTSWKCLSHLKGHFGIIRMIFEGPDTFTSAFFTNSTLALSRLSSPTWGASQIITLQSTFKLNHFIFTSLNDQYIPKKQNSETKCVSHIPNPHNLKITFRSHNQLTQFRSQFFRQVWGATPANSQLTFPMKTTGLKSFRSVKLTQ